MDIAFAHTNTYTGLEGQFPSRVDYFPPCLNHTDIVSQEEHSVYRRQHTLLLFLSTGYAVFITLIYMSLSFRKS